jgi:hypothetical protein
VATLELRPGARRPEKINAEKELFAIDRYAF